MLKKGVSGATREVLQRCIAEYNRMCGGNKRHRIDTQTKSLVLNMLLGVETVRSYLRNFRLRAEDDIQHKIHRHYDLYPHALSGDQPFHPTKNQPKTSFRISNSIDFTAITPRSAIGGASKRLVDSRKHLTAGGQEVREQAAVQRDLHHHSRGHGAMGGTCYEGHIYHKQSVVLSGLHAKGSS